MATVGTLVATAAKPEADEPAGAEWSLRTSPAGESVETVRPASDWLTAAPSATGTPTTTKTASAPADGGTALSDLVDMLELPARSDRL